MERRISINTLGLAAGDLADHVDQVARIGAGAISPTLEEIVAYGVTPARRVLAEAGLAVATLTHRSFGYATPALAAAACARLAATIETAAAIGADSVTLTSGGREGLSWYDAAAQFAATIAAPCAAQARIVGVKLALEPTSHLYADVSIAHRLGDAALLAQHAGIHVGIDLFPCWTDSDIEAQIVLTARHAALVQVSDYVAGDRGLPCRAVPGDGMIPLKRLIGRLVDAGFTGWFDLELIGPRIAAEGPEPAHRRAMAVLERLISP